MSRTLMNKRLLHWLFLIIAVMLIITLLRSVLGLLEKGKIIEEREKRLEAGQKKKRELEEKLNEAKSEAYIEKQAREKLNLAKENEIVVILPKITPEPEREELPELANWQKWIKLFW